MVSLYGRDWSQQTLVERVGHMDQLAGVRSLEAADGLARGSRVLEAWTGSGLRFTVLPDRALDLSTCSYKGVPLAWNSPVGQAHPAYHEPEGLGFLRTFGGGLLVTCGLDHFGSPCEDDGDQFGLHGRVGHLPARAVGYRTWWEGDAYAIEITGEVRQARVFGENLVLLRRISTRLGSNVLHIEDTVTNEGFRNQPHMILYHFNLGFPLVSEDTRLHIEAENTIPRDADAEPGIEDWMRFQSPTPGYSEQVFCHTPVADSDGKAHVELANPVLGVGLRWTYDRAALPHLFEWKMMGRGTYVVGIEPGNSGAIQGRATARRTNDLPHLAPGESRTYALDLEVIEYA